MLSNKKLIKLKKPNAISMSNELIYKNSKEKTK